MSEVKILPGFEVAGMSNSSQVLYYFNLPGEAYHRLLELMPHMPVPPWVSSPSSNYNSRTIVTPDPTWFQRLVEED